MRRGCRVRSRNRPNRTANPCLGVQIGEDEQLAQLLQFRKAESVGLTYDPFEIQRTEHFRVP